MDLHSSCRRSVSVEEFFFVLCQPNINVNSLNDIGQTPLHYLCNKFTEWSEDLAKIRLLLQHPRIIPNFRDRWGRTPFCIARESGNILIMKLLLAVHYHSYLDKLLEGDNLTTVTEREREREREREKEKEKEKEKDLDRLLLNLKSRPILTRNWLRSTCGLIPAHFSLFSAIVFVSDGLLRLKRDSRRSKAGRYFALARRLPLELQMILSYRTFNSSKDLMLSKDTNLAFIELSQYYILEHNIERYEKIGVISQLNLSTNQKQILINKLY